MDGPLVRLVLAALTESKHDYPGLIQRPAYHDSKNDWEARSTTLSRILINVHFQT
jgi:hypothetical protein